MISQVNVVLYRRPRTNDSRGIVIILVNHTEVLYYKTNAMRGGRVGIHKSRKCDDYIEKTWPFANACTDIFSAIVSPRQVLVIHNRNEIINTNSKEITKAIQLRVSFEADFCVLTKFNATKATAK